MASVSARTTSRDSRSVPDSPDPSDFRDSARSFLAYSSSIAARAVHGGQNDSFSTSDRRKHTSVERLHFVACHFGIVHALEHRSNAPVIFTPEVIGNCVEGRIDISRRPELSLQKRKQRHTG